MKVFWIFIYFIVTCVEDSFGTLSKSDQKTKAKFKIKVGSQSDSVFDRSLVVPEPTSKEIIQEHGTYCSKTRYRNFDGPVLSYVTPWNSRGYDVAKNFTSKFTNISPVWLQVHRRGNNKYEVLGTHDIDKKWISSLRKNNPNVHIDVRVIFEGWSVQDFTALFSQSSEQIALSEAVTRVCVSNNFDGIVLELWSQVGGSLRSDVLANFIKLLSSKLKNKGLELILVVPPKRESSDFFSEKDFNDLYDYVVGFSLMTYDFSNPQRPGPNSPLDWVKQCVIALVPTFEVKRKKILLGLNFYGNSYTATGGGPILGRDFVELLNNYKGKLKFDDISVENFFEIRSGSGKQLIFYPTLFSIHQRIKLAEELGTGLSIWELGQGLDYFYDLL